MSGIASERVVVTSASALSWPALMNWIAEGTEGDAILHLSAEQVTQCKRDAAIRHIHHVDEACCNVYTSAWGKAGNKAYRPRWIGLRPCDARDGGQRGSARGQKQKFSAGKFHG